MDSVDQTQIRLGGKHLYQLCHLVGPSVTVFNVFLFLVCAMLYFTVLGMEHGTLQMLSTHSTNELYTSASVQQLFPVLIK